MRKIPEKLDRLSMAANFSGVENEEECFQITVAFISTFLQFLAYLVVFFDSLLPPGIHYFITRKFLLMAITI